jgi:hypothetical protein
MESSEEQEWTSLVLRSLKSLENMNDQEMQKSIEIAQSIRTQLNNSNTKAAIVALMMMQLEDLDPPVEEYDIAFV